MKNIRKIPPRWDDRQVRIKGWNREALKNAVILIEGAGAISNEVIKNLALLGIGHVIICDFDRVELSNLTRTILFTKQDIGELKAPLAGRRFLELNLEETASADYFLGDISYELGDGVFRRVDLVLGCLDNVETRFSVNRICMRYDIPYIDAAIGSLDWNMHVMNGHGYGCMECYAGNALNESRTRSSCSDTMSKAEEQGKAATVQTASAIVAGFQVQEALRILCGMSPSFGREYMFFSDGNRMYNFPMEQDPKCEAHLTKARKEVEETPLSCGNTLREFLAYVKEKGFDTLDVSMDKERGFVLSAPCPYCRSEVPVRLPYYRYFANDFFCEDCRRENRGFFNKVDKSDLCMYDCYSLADTPQELLDMPLAKLGIPALHVLTVRDSETGKTAFFELTADLSEVLPGYSKKIGK